MSPNKFSSRAASFTDSNKTSRWIILNLLDVRIPSLQAITTHFLHRQDMKYHHFNQSPLIFCIYHKISKNHLN
jgi:hypothetical protein